MHIYFDTNIYSYICSTGETVEITKILRRHDCTLVASAGNLFEMYAIRVIKPAGSRDPDFG